MLNIVLLEPEIPHNTGAIGRTCVATNSFLHLIEPLGFQIEDKQIKRTGLDYWPFLKYKVHKSYQDFLFFYANDCRNHRKQALVEPNLYFATTKAKYRHDQISYKNGDYIMFGKESAGIPEEILVQRKQNCLRIPMWGEVRSLNLSNAVAVVVYEAYRQLAYEDFAVEGNLHRLSW